MALRNPLDNKGSVFFLFFSKLMTFDTALYLTGVLELSLKCVEEKMDYNTLLYSTLLPSTHGCSQSPQIYTPNYYEVSSTTDRHNHARNCSS